MQKFLDSDSIQGAVVDLIAKADNVDIAVAFWGKGAIEKLQLPSDRPIRILCDLLSGGCNPNEIKRLLEHPSVGNKDFEVHYLDKLHAKVFRTPTSVIVGSANASANGLGEEGRIGTLEAAIQTDDVAVRAQIGEWFKALWGRSKRIDDEALKKAREAWRRKRPEPDPNATVLYVLANDPDWFRERVWVTYYETEATDDANTKFEEVKRDYYSPKQLEAFGKDNLPFYDWLTHDASQTAPGDTIIDLGDNKIYELIETIPYSRTHCVALLKPVDNVQGLRFPREQRALLRKVIKDHLGPKQKDYDCNLEDLPPDVRSELLEAYRRASNESQQ